MVCESTAGKRTDCSKQKQVYAIDVHEIGSGAVWTKWECWHSKGITLHLLLSKHCNRHGQSKYEEAGVKQCILSTLAVGIGWCRVIHKTPFPSGGWQSQGCEWGVCKCVPLSGHCVWVLCLVIYLVGFIFSHQKQINLICYLLHLLPKVWTTKTSIFLPLWSYTWKW